ncbi:SH3 domain-containing protein [Marinoscillum pacificum]|uniref:SH3 domain-containing protein n=1 Tax=Marinoscillum pacificum TaxID=392723 RepID=UPI002157A28F|nr:SH3 domain-containing protein [Marinoscillum pacificum]
MRAALVLILLCSLLDTVAQQPIKPEKLYRVIPVNGLNLREQPSLNSRVLVSVPFSEEISTTEVVGSDTIIDGSKGHWIKAKYKNHSGYVFSGFIENYKYVKAGILNSQYRIQPEGLIITELSYDPALNWYGLYHDLTSDMFTLENVEIVLKSYKSSVNGLCADLSIENPNRKGNPGFFIGSDKKFHHGIMRITRTDLMKCTTDTSGCKLNMGNNYYLIFVDSNDEKNLKSIKVSSKQVEQTLVSETSKSSFVRIEFAEDLDNDQNIDLILNIYEDIGDGAQGGKYYLFLSSEAKGSNIVELVSTYSWRTGGCD